MPRALRAGLGACLLLAATARATTAATLVLPAERRHVYDLAGWLGAEKAKELDDRLADYEKTTGHRIVLLLVKKDEVGPFDQDFEPVIARATEQWGLSSDKEHASVLFVYTGWPLVPEQLATDLGKRIPALDAGKGAILSTVDVVMHRAMAHPPAVEAGVDAIEARIGGGPGSAAASGATPVAENAVGWVIDEAGVLSEGTQEDLNGILAGHEKKTSNQVVVLTVKSLNGEPIEDVALRRATALKAGQKGKDNGVLVLVAPNEHRVRIEVGYGLEADLPDARCKAIIAERMTPAFKEGDLDRGVREGVSAILASIEGSYQPSVAERVGLRRFAAMPSLPVGAQVAGGLFFWLLGPPILSLPLFFIRSPGRKWFTGVILLMPLAAIVGSTNPWIFVWLLILPAAYLLIRYGPEMPSGSASSGGTSWSSSAGSSSSSWSSGSSSGSSSSGGSSFSGGGGSFGGGGASGGW